MRALGVAVSIPEGYKRVHFIGIKGVGVSAVARILKAEGVEVSGSDVPTKFPTDAGLLAAGIVPARGFDPKNIGEPDLVVHSPAWGPDNPEVAEAKRRGLPLLSYPEFLGLLMRSRRGISIAGTHGKTTTTAMTALILHEAGLDPQAVIGVGEAYIGKGDFLVVESCEYRRHFLNYRPEIAVVTSIEWDHPDYFRTMDDYVLAFREFAALLPPKGLLIANGDDKLAAGLPTPARKLTYGLGSGNDWRLVPRAAAGENRFRVVVSRPAGGGEAGRGGGGQGEGGAPDRGAAAQDLGEFVLPVPGRHNALNALAALAVAREVGVDADVARQALARFRGVHRRLEYVGEYRGVPVYDDYAHHPTAIAVTIEAVRETMPCRRLWLVFQPHTYSRTEALKGEFVRALARADEVVLAETFSSAREARRANPDLGHMAREVEKAAARLGTGARAVYLPTFDAIKAHLRQGLRKGDVLLTMGAGDVYHVAYDLVGRKGA